MCKISAQRSASSVEDVALALEYLSTDRDDGPNDAEI
jgi:hypothetical protein